MLYIIFNFNNTNNIDSTVFTHSSVFEIVWTVFPAFILLILSIPSFTLLYSLDENIDASLSIKIMGNQLMPLVMRLLVKKAKRAVIMFLLLGGISLLPPEGSNALEKAIVGTAFFVGGFMVPQTIKWWFGTNNKPDSGADSQGVTPLVILLTKSQFRKHMKLPTLGIERLTSVFRIRNDF
jgi:heme/copper-type cytochrome/quinol oxidase subunit 2